MRKRKSVNIGDVFVFEITDEIIKTLEVQPKDIYAVICSRYEQLPNKLGYGVVVNKNKNCILIEIKRTNKKEPTLDEIYNSKTISIQWTWETIMFEREYKVVGNLSIEPSKVENFWVVGGKDYCDFVNGKEVDIHIVEVNGDFAPMNIINVTRDTEVLKELFRFKGYGTKATIMMDYLLDYYRDENDINTLRV